MWKVIKFKQLKLSITKFHGASQILTCAFYSILHIDFYDSNSLTLNRFSIIYGTTFCYDNVTGKLRTFDVQAIFYEMSLIKLCVYYQMRQNHCSLYTSSKVLKPSLDPQSTNNHISLPFRVSWWPLHPRIGGETSPSCLYSRSIPSTFPLWNWDATSMEWWRVSGSSGLNHLAS